MIKSIQLRKGKETDCWHSRARHLRSKVDPSTLICISLNYITINKNYQLGRTER